MILLNDLHGNVVISSNVLSGNLNSSSLLIDGNLIHGGSRQLPAYTGSYEVTPSSETQVLSTNDKRMTDDIIINPIPSNYGLITWNGSFLTVS